MTSELTVDLQRLPQELSETQVLVTGAGVSGVAIARLLNQIGVAVTIADDNESARDRAKAQLPDATTVYVAEAARRLSNFGLVVTSPGWRPDTPLLVAAEEYGLEVIGDVELCWRLDHAGVFGAPRTWLVVTGTNGKTTTTAMLAEMMIAGGRAAKAVGNIGLPIPEALLAQDRVDVLCAELSSFQLHWSSHLHPEAGVVLNLADDHLDWHGSMKAYANAKAKALYADVPIMGIDDPGIKQIIRPTFSGVEFTMSSPQKGQVGVVDGQMIDRAFSDDPQGTAISSVDGIEPKGPVGVLDALAATAMARSQGVGSDAIARALDEFQVAGHRGQVVSTSGDITWIDNSKATNPHAAQVAMSGVPNLVWVGGGQLKGASIMELLDHVRDTLRGAVFLGVDRKILAHALSAMRPELPVYVIDDEDPHQAMKQAVRAARTMAQPGDTVMLAPAAASLDMFTGMSQRGDLFAEEARSGPNPGDQEA